MRNKIGVIAYAKQNNFDFGTLYGAFAAFGLVFVAIYLGGSFETFIDLKSVLIVLGGTIGATLINFPLEDFQKTLSTLKPAFFPELSPPEVRLRKIITLAMKVKTDGALALENDSYRESDPFLKKCLQLTVDGLKPDDIRRIMEIELGLQEDRHRRGAELFQTMGNVAPAMGLIGTLIGLVQMLQRLEDPAALGPAMAVAFVSTFYGATLSNIVFRPLAGKLRRRSQEEMLIKEMTMEGILSIANGTHPRLVEQHLLSFLPPEERRSQFNAF